MSICLINIKLKEEKIIMTIWHVQRLYHGDKPYYCVLPYNLKGTIEVTMQMKKGVIQTMKFLISSRLTEKSADKLCEKKNRLLENSM